MKKGNQHHRGKLFALDQKQWWTSKTYRKATASARRAAGHAAHKLLSAAVNLAVAGAWKEWNDRLPAGATIPLAPMELLAADDPRVQEILAVWDRVMALEDSLAGFLAKHPARRHSSQHRPEHEKWGAADEGDAEASDLDKDDLA